MFITNTGFNVLTDLLRTHITPQLRNALSNLNQGINVITTKIENHIMNIVYKISGNTRSCMIVYNYIEDESIFIPQPMILNESSVNEEA